MKEIVAIIGGAKQTRALFDYSRTDADVWHFNEVPGREQDRVWAKRTDACFQLHIPEIWRSPVNMNDNAHYQWLKSGNTPPVYMQDKYDDVPNSVKFPLVELLETTGHNTPELREQCYLTSSPAYAIALAVYLGYKKIELYGIEMESGTEYESQRPGITYWIGYARGKGIEVEFHTVTMNFELYAYETDAQIPYEEFTGRLSELSKQIDTAKINYKMAEREITQILRDFLTTNNDSKLSEAVNKATQFALDLGRLVGAQKQIEDIKSQADKQIESVGSYMFSRQQFERLAAAFARAHSTKQMESKAKFLRLESMYEEVRKTSNPEKRKNRMDNLIKEVNSAINSVLDLGVMDGSGAENARLMLVHDKIRKGQKELTPTFSEMFTDKVEEYIR